MINKYRDAIISKAEEIIDMIDLSKINASFKSIAMGLTYISAYMVVEPEDLPKINQWKISMVFKGTDVTLRKVAKKIADQIGDKKLKARLATFSRRGRPPREIILYNL